MTWLIVPAARFSAHAQAWDALQRRATDTPFLESGFLAPLLQEFGSGRELLAMHHAANGEPDTAALLRPAGRGSWDTFQPSQLPLGPWIALPGQPLEPRLRSLFGALPGLALGLGATQLDPRLQQRPADGPQLRTLDYIQTSYIDIAGPWDAYWEARGKNLRQNTRKQLKKLAEEGTAPTLECITDPAQVPQAIAHYGALEITGWKAGGGTAIHPDNAQGRFYTQMLQNFCSLGRGRILRYRFGDKVVAMDLCIDNGPLVVVLKTAYDESYRSISPSVLMRHEEFKAWWSEGRYQRIEFYGKTMEWHTRWTSDERTLYHATAYRWPWLRSLHDRLRQRPTQGAATPPAAAAALPGP
jgi:CelD/BcsL family acetyltransferase involved in cellulose biosynthesis